MKYHPGSPVYPAIYIIRKLFDKLVWNIRYEKEPFTDFSRVEEEFDQCLTDCLKEIFDLDRPFTQTTEEKHCQYCDFKLLCKR